jgi:hypothetical protein
LASLRLHVKTASLGAPDNNPVFQLIGLKKLAANYFAITTCDRISTAGLARTGRAFSLLEPDRQSASNNAANDWK